MIYGIDPTGQLAVRQNPPEVLLSLFSFLVIRTPSSVSSDLLSRYKQNLLFTRVVRFAGSESPKSTGMELQLKTDPSSFSLFSSAVTEAALARSRFLSSSDRLGPILLNF